LDLCPWIQGESLNLHSKYKCKEPGFAYTSTSIIAALTELDCVSATNSNNQAGVWTAFTHAMTGSPVMDCLQMDWTRDNHLGNTANGQMVSYNWTIPSFSMLTSSGVLPSGSSVAGTPGTYIPTVQTYGAANNYVKCVFRLRYNLTTDDYDPWNTTSSSDQNAGTGTQSPVTQNPTVDVGTMSLQGLALAINTNQFGRTFQDRSHVFYIKQRPASSPLTGKNIWNVNVRGKRANIVQAYPALEYDFVPNILTVSAATDLIHIQWTGSNTANNGDPGGDGQTGDAGEGEEGTDRHSWAQAADSAANYPLPLDKYEAEAFLMSGNSICYANDATITALDTKYPYTGSVSGYTQQTGTICALQLLTSGQYLAVADVSNEFNPTLDDAPASLVGGIIIKPVTPGLYNYLDTRNNNFSNRSTKGAFTVTT